MEKDILLLTKSHRYGGLCVVGFDIADKKFIRLLSSDDNIQNSLSIKHLYYENGETAQIKDIVRVDLKGKKQDKIHKEDWYINESKKFKFIRKGNLQEIINGSNFEEEYIFGNTDYFVDRENIENITKSIQFVIAKNITLYCNDSKRVKAYFYNNNNYYKNFAVTDPEYTDFESQTKYEFPVKYEYALLIISLPTENDKWSKEHNQYYKFVAKIFPLKLKKAKETN